MFDFIKGKIESKNFPYCTIECNSIGYQILVNQRTMSSIGEIGDEIKMYLKLIHKEDSMTLCGFKNKQDRIIFDILTSVSGVGTKAGFALLDEFETNDLINAIISKDDKLISKTKGIGSKTAQKIVLEIKDKLTKIEVHSDIISSSNNKISNDTVIQTTTILQSLGYSNKEYQKALELALSKLEKDNPEELLKESLKILSAF